MKRVQGDQELETPQELAARLNLRFNRISNLARALTHRSYLNENPDVVEDNERLEFLGDAVLDFLVADWLYHRFPEMAEGDLTRLRAALVATPRLAEFGRQFEIGPAIRLGRGEAEGGGRERDTILCATFEAIIGALYLDSGIQAVRAFFEPLLEPATEQILRNRQAQDCKSLLQEWSQSRGWGVPVYRLVSVSGPDHRRVYEIEVSLNDKVYGRGSGSSKQAASKAAACDALSNLNVD